MKTTTVVLSFAQLKDWANHVEFQELWSFEEFIKMPLNLEPLNRVLKRHTLPYNPELFCNIQMDRKTEKVYVIFEGNQPVQNWDAALRGVEEIGSWLYDEEALMEDFPGWEYAKVSLFREFHDSYRDFDYVGRGRYVMCLAQLCWYALCF